ncbi:MAG: ABC transporter ATP-binding protein [Pseudomonadota bacterium]
MIEITKLTKQFGHLRAVDDLSLRVGAGEVLGFLGPNGAGKSTTMKLVCGFLTPDSGSISVGGHDVVTAPLEAKKRIGYLPEGAPSYPEMTVGQFLKFIADIRGLDGAEGRRKAGEVIERLQLAAVVAQPIETLSKGFKRRVGLAQAIMHDPDVLVLDEPTDGLDPNQKHQVRELINGMSSDKIIIISTHILEEVQAVCNRAVIIAQGRILADDTPANLEARSAYHNAVTLRFADPERRDVARSAIGALPDVARTSVGDDGRLTAFPKAGASLLATVTGLAIDNDWKVDELALESGRLDEVFRTITAKPDASAGSAGAGEARA